MIDIKVLLFSTFLICLGKLSFAQFQDIAPTIGITTGSGNGLFGAGISFCDFNGDGLDDLTLGTSFGLPIRFFENINGTLTEIPPLIPNTEEVKQILWADYDNDGDKDLFISVYNGFNRLYNNDGNMNLTDVTIASQIPANQNPTFGASFVDFDNDGWLDLYIANRGFNTSSSIKTNLLLRNNQNGTFTNVTNAQMVGNGNTLTFMGVFFDYNKDLFPDLCLIEDKSFPNVFLRNSAGNFADVSVASNMDVIMDAMNGGVGDYDNDGDLDIYITNTTPGVTNVPQQGNVLFRNNNDGTFTDVAPSAGVVYNNWSWGGNWLDYDNDMDLDLYVCSSTSTPNAFYENDGSGNFTLPFPMGLPGDNTVTMVNAIGDFNNDGLMDMAVCANNPDPFLIWENTSPTTHNWIKVALEGVQSNRDGIGAWIETTTNGFTQFRYPMSGEAFLAQNTQNHHIGIGSNTLIDNITIKWPSGVIDVINNVLPNQRIVVKEGMGLILGNVQACANTLHVNATINNTTYIADQILTSDGIIPTGFMIQFQAGDCIELQADFEVELGADFETTMQGCL